MDVDMVKNVRQLIKFYEKQRPSKSDQKGPVSSRRFFKKTSLRRQKKVFYHKNRNENRAIESRSDLQSDSSSDKVTMRPKLCTEFEDNFMSSDEMDQVDVFGKLGPDDEQETLLETCNYPVANETLLEVFNYHIDLTPKDKKRDDNHLQIVQNLMCKSMRRAPSPPPIMESLQSPMVHQKETLKNSFDQRFDDMNETILEDEDLVKIPRKAFRSLSIGYMPTLTWMQLQKNSPIRKRHSSCNLSFKFDVVEDKEQSFFRRQSSMVNVSEDEHTEDDDLRSETSDGSEKSEETEEKQEDEDENVQESSGEDDKNEDLQPKKTKMDYIIEELVQTENNYANALQNIIHDYLEYLNTKIKLREEVEILFRYLQIICAYTTKFLKLLKRCDHDWEKIAKSFLVSRDLFEMYPFYATQKARCEQYFLDDCEFSEKLKQRQFELQQSFDLHSQLLAPVQRLPKLKLMLQSIEEELHKSDIFSRSLTQAIRMVDRQLRMSNNYIMLDSIKRWPSDVEFFNIGLLILKDNFVVRSRSKYSSTVFLFEKMLVFTVQLNADDYLYYESINIRNIGIGKSRSKTLSFEIRRFYENGGKSIYVLEAKSMEVKRAWYSAISQKLIEQLQEEKKSAGLQNNRSKSPEKFVNTKYVQLKINENIKPKKNQEKKTVADALRTSGSFVSYLALSKSQTAKKQNNV